MSKIATEKVLELFPCPLILRQIGTPNCGSIWELRNKLNLNALSAESKLWWGRTRTSLPYHVSCGTPRATRHAFVPPANPGPTPVIANNETAHTVRASTSLHTTQLNNWNVCAVTEKALKNQIIGAFEPAMLESLWDRRTGFINVSAL